MSESRIDIGLPEKMGIYSNGSCLNISIKWLGWKVIYMTIFSIVWNGFIANQVQLIVSKNQSWDSALPLLPFFIAGLGMIYYVLAGWLNKTNILITHANITIRHTPIPWFGNKELAASDLKQIYVKECVSESENGKTASYQVHAITNKAANIMLLEGLESSEQGLFVEQEIEKYLNITDVPVKGEFGGSIR